jgi:hypothetical protein
MVLKARQQLDSHEGSLSFTLLHIPALHDRVAGREDDLPFAVAGNNTSTTCPSLTMKDVSVLILIHPADGAVHRGTCTVEAMVCQFTWSFPWTRLPLPLPSVGCIQVVVWSRS